MGTILSWKTNLAAAIQKIGIGLAGIGRFPGHTLWYYYTIYRVISDMHWDLRGGKPHWDTSLGRGTSLGWVEFCIMILIWLPRIHN